MLRKTISGMRFGVSHNGQWDYRDYLTGLFKKEFLNISMILFCSLKLLKNYQTNLLLSIVEQSISKTLSYRVSRDICSFISYKSFCKVLLNFSIPSEKKIYNIHDKDGKKVHMRLRLICLVSISSVLVIRNFFLIGLIQQLAHRET